MEHSVTLLVLKVQFWGYAWEFAFLSSCSPLMYSKGQLLIFQKYYIIHFSNFPCQIKDPIALLADKTLSKAPLLFLNQVIWNLEWTQTTQMHNDSLSASTCFN